jgi:hypothetical protein
LDQEFPPHQLNISLKMLMLPAQVDDAAATAYGIAAAPCPRLLIEA